MKRLLLFSLVTLVTVVCMVSLTGIVTGTDTSPPAVAEQIIFRTGNVNVNANAGIAEVAGLRKLAEAYTVMPTTVIRKQVALAGSVHFRQGHCMLAKHVEFRHGNGKPSEYANVINFRHSTQARGSHIQTSEFDVEYKQQFRLNV